MTPTPPPPSADLGLPMSVWTYLPLLVCLVFATAILVGFLFIVRENRRIARQSRMIEESEQNQES